MIGVELRKNKALSLLHPRLLSPLIASFVTNKVDTVHAGWERERCNERQQRMMGNWNAGLGFSCHAQIPVHNIIRSNTTKGQKHRIWWQSRKKCTLGHQIKEKKSTILVLVLLERERRRNHENILYRWTDQSVPKINYCLKKNLNKTEDYLLHTPPWIVPSP